MKNVKDWEQLDYYQKPFKLNEDGYCNFIASVITMLYEYNKSTKFYESKNISEEMKNIFLKTINKSISKLRENNTNGSSSPFEKSKKVNNIEYKETLFFIDYPIKIKEYQRSHLIDYNILNSLNKSARFEFRALKNLILLLWTLEKTCCYCSSKKIEDSSGKIMPGNSDISLGKSPSGMVGIENVKVFVKGKNNSSRNISIDQFVEFRKSLFEAKELLVEGINKGKDNTTIVIKNYRNIYTDIENATGQKMDKEVVNKIMSNVINVIL